MSFLAAIGLTTYVTIKAPIPPTAKDINPLVSKHLKNYFVEMKWKAYPRPYKVQIKHIKYKGCTADPEGGAYNQFFCISSVDVTVNGKPHHFFVKPVVGPGGFFGSWSLLKLNLPSSNKLD